MADQPADTGAISVDQAVGLLGARPEPIIQTAEATPRGAPAPEAAPDGDEEDEIEESPAETEAEETVEPEEVTTEDDLEEPEDAEDPPIPAPKSWSAADKALFATLPREAQEVLLNRETDRDKAVQRSVQEASDAKKAAETARAEAASVTQIKAALDQITPAAFNSFQSKWAAWTPAARAELALKDPGQVVALDAQYAAESSELARLDAVTQEANAKAFNVFVQQQEELIKTAAPDLADPKEGLNRRKALAQFLVDAGVPANQIPNLDANTISLAYDAYRWRTAQTKAATAVAPKKLAPVAASPAVRPAAAAPAPTRTRSRDVAMDRLSKTGSIDDGVAALKALRAQRK